ncbi:MAG: DUF4062 domain-containing protein [Muribaculaceae bacterium]|nr:DUF4062 domain-containing protein [Muribaculaceae bacterium]
MNHRKRYQIFVSSTFADLEEERGKVMETILRFDCFPAGMEMFPAMDEEIFEYIKRIIDDSDYYLLIIGGRYGSVDHNGVSWTEKEFDYAVEKGIPVLAFDHHDFTKLPASKTDLDDSKRKKLLAFKKRVATGRLIKKWYSADDLVLAVAKALPRVLEQQPRTGWVRANTKLSNNSRDIINRLQKRIKDLEISQKEGQDRERLDQEDHETIQLVEGKTDKRRDPLPKNDYNCFLTEERIQKMITEAIRALVQSSLHQETKDEANVSVRSVPPVKQPKTKKKNRIYICYRHDESEHRNRDEKVASEICSALESKKYECCMLSRDFKDVIVDTRISSIRSIIDAVHSCGLLIIVLSKESFEDKYSDIIFAAVKTAVGDGIKIKPFCIDTLKEKDQKDPLKTYLKRSTIIDASGDSNSKIPTLIEYVKGELGDPPKK